MTKPLTFAFFGGEPLAVPVLGKLKAAGLMPSVTICNPDRPAGRGHILTPPPVKKWAEDEGISIFQPTTYKDDSVRAFFENQSWDLFVVVAYNFILPEWLLKLPKHGVINLHPSMLPRLRGASPIRTAILDNTPDAVGVTIMLMDKEMDHGPILEQEQYFISESEWPIAGPTLDAALAQRGGTLLAETIPAWVEGLLSPQEQEHEMATYCQKLTKEQSELTIDPFQLPAGEAGRHAWRVINAFAGISDAFFIYQGKRIKIKKAEFVSGTLRILRVTPEGKKEVEFSDYLHSITL